MGKIFTFFVSGVLLLGVADSVSAQASDLALGQAKARLACGTGTIISSQFLPDGSLEVTCSQSPASASSALLAGTGLTTAETLGLVGIVVVLGALIGSSGDGSSSSTTTTTSSTSSP